jgi:hypothetical protein
VSTAIAWVVAVGLVAVTIGCAINRRTPKPTQEIDVPDWVQSPRPPLTHEDAERFEVEIHSADVMAVLEREVSS